MRDQRQIRTLIVLRNRILRDALQDVLSRSSALQVVRCLARADASTLNLEIENHLIDIVILHADVGVARLIDDICALKLLRQDARVLVIGLAEKDSEILSVIEAGAAGIATNAVKAEELIANIVEVFNGNTLCSPHIAGLLFSRLAKEFPLHEFKSKSRGAHITRREREVIELIERGLTNKAIAYQLGIEVQTVKNHVHHILEKLEFGSRMEVARYARKVGWAKMGTSTLTRTFQNASD